MGGLAKEKNIKSFDRDTESYGGYQYTTGVSLSSKLANNHITDIVLEFIDVKDKRVIDVGCGDGTYTIEVAKRGGPVEIVGFDPSRMAIRAARKKAYRLRNIKFMTGNVYKIPVEKKYDIAIVRGVLHHLYEPERAIEEISKVAKYVLIVEPNGYNPVLKLIEKTSKYHIEHEEKSYFPCDIERWINKRHGEIVQKKYAGLVPFFCPESMAKLLKLLEPIIENTPGVNHLVCGNYYLLYKTSYAC